MSCPDLYFGSSRTQAPPFLFWLNPAIDVPPSLRAGSPVAIHVTLRNHGNETAPPTNIELFWHPPSTGFAPPTLTPIGDCDLDDGVPAATDLPPADGEAAHNFVWTPPTGVRHVCFLARAHNTAPPEDGACPQQAYCEQPYWSDPLTAVRNVFVVAQPAVSNVNTALSVRSAKQPDPGPLAFAFASTNGFPDTDDTRLHVRVLDPSQDRERLQALATDPAVYDVLARRGLKFAAPSGLRLAYGRERVRLAPRATGCQSGISRLGAVNPRELQYLLAPGMHLEDVKRPIEMKLLPYEMQQTLLQVEPCGRDHVAYVVDIEHRDPGERIMGGMTIVFVPPHNFF